MSLLTPPSQARPQRPMKSQVKKLRHVKPGEMVNAKPLEEG